MINVKRGVLIAGVLGLSLLTAALAQNYAWWVTVRFEPEGTSVDELAVEDLDPSWVAATALTEAILPEEASEPGRRIQDYGESFEVSWDFDGDGRLEKAIVGVYRSSAGEAGRFLAILEADVDSWSMESLFKQPGQTGFSVLRDNDRQLEWWFCLKCDLMCVVLPTTSQYDLECHRAEEPQG